MTQRTRTTLALATAAALLCGGAASAAPKAKPVAKPTQEVITIQRTAHHGLAALALIGKIKAQDAPGFFATIDRTSGGSVMRSAVDFSGTSGINRYGHGATTSLCDAPLVCSLDLDTNTLTFTFTETSDADAQNDEWSGLTRYLAIRGTHLDLQVAAIGFTVKRHTQSSFARVTRDQADADGVSVDTVGAEVFRAAQLAGGRRGSFALLQLPCDGEGAGAVTFTATGDNLPAVLDCTPHTDEVRVGILAVGPVSTYDREGVFSRTANRATQWQVNGLVSGVSNSVTRLFVLNY
jgi:hypothetical protein